MMPAPKFDHELRVIRNIFNQLAALQPSARRRVLDYVMARADSLPVLAAVGGGLEDDEDDQPEMFDPPPPDGGDEARPR